MTVAELNERFFEINSLKQQDEENLIKLEKNINQKEKEIISLENKIDEYKVLIDFKTSNLPLKIFKLLFCILNKKIIISFSLILIFSILFYKFFLLYPLVFCGSILTVYIIYKLIIIANLISNEDTFSLVLAHDDYYDDLSIAKSECMRMQNSKSELLKKIKMNGKKLEDLQILLNSKRNAGGESIDAISLIDTEQTTEHLASSEYDLSKIEKNKQKHVELLGQTRTRKKKGSK